MPTSAPQTDRPVFVLDTNVLLAAVAHGRSEGPDNNSTLDRDTRKKLEPENLRGRIINMLAVGAIAIPEVVRAEIEALTNRTNSPLGEKNKRVARRLLETLSGRTITITPTREEITRQGNAVETLQERAELHADSLRKTGIDVPPNWWDTLGDKDNGQPPAWKTQLRAIQTAVTWSKIASLAPSAIAERAALPATGETTQRELLKKAVALRQLNDRPEAPQDQETPARNKTISELEAAAESAKPQLIPDWEIYFTAQRCQAYLITLDNDMRVIAEQTTGPSPEINRPGQDGPATTEALLSAIADNLKNHRKVPRRLNRPFEIQ